MDLVPSEHVPAILPRRHIVLWLMTHRLKYRVILEEHRKNCEAQGKYVEAEIAKNRLEELRQHEFSRRKEALRSRQIAERLGVEEAHMLEFQQFNAAWDKKFQEYETKAAELEEKMKVSSWHLIIAAPADCVMIDIP
jgi:hypothetical protein